MSDRPPRTDQTAFTTALLDPRAPPPAGLTRVAGHAPVKRFNVYRNNVVVSLVNALKSGFPTVEKLVGEAFFGAMAAEFARAHPPESPILMRYDADFADWIAAFPPAARLPYLADAARLDQARRDAYHAADAEPGDPQAFERAVAAIGPERAGELTVALHPALRWVASAHPLLAIFHAAHAAEEIGHGAIDAGRQTVLITRPRLEVRQSAAPAGAEAFLTALAEGRPLGAAAAAAAAQAPSEFDLAGCLGALIEAEGFTDVAQPR